MVTTPSAVAAARGGRDAGMSKPIVAVLPLANLSASADDEYFSDGVSEDIIAQLSRIAELQVIARTSVMRYKKTEKRAREIGTDLGATHIIEGSVRRAGQKLRIVAQLIDSSTEQAIWTETFDRELADVFAIQSEVAERVVGALTSRLTARDAKQGTQGTQNLEAYDAYLRGRFEWNKGTREGLRRSIEHFERAITLDGDFASAHAGLAGVLCISAVFISDAAGAFEQARTHVMEALRLDPKLPEAHALLGYIQFGTTGIGPRPSGCCGARCSSARTRRSLTTTSRCSSRILVDTTREWKLHAGRSNSTPSGRPPTTMRGSRCSSRDD
jgi:adenylate cyclase